MAQFKKLECIELLKVQASIIEDWPYLNQRLVCLVLHEAIAQPDASDLPQSFNITSTPDSTDSVVTSSNSTRVVKRRSSSIYPEVTYINLSQNSLKTLCPVASKMFGAALSLNLSANNFESIPAAVLDMSSLKTLNLSQNKLIDLTLSPPASFNLASLTWLSLRKNSIEILTGIEGLKSLKHLDISDNNIQEVFEIGRLAVLESLVELLVSGNPFAKTVCAIYHLSDDFSIINVYSGGYVGSLPCKHIYLFQRPSVRIDIGRTTTQCN
jgi:Leucine-rich repeat (LRR) protein